MIPNLCIPNKHMMTNSEFPYILLHIFRLQNVFRNVEKIFRPELRGFTARRRRWHLKVCRNVQRMKMASAITRIKGGKLMILVLIALVHGGKKVTQSAVFCGWSVGVYFQTHDDQLKIQIYSFQTNT